jgi:hypothetical protein
MNYMGRVLTCAWALAFTTANAPAETGRFETIAKQNAFRLSQPAPESTRAVEPARPRLALQGLTTILGVRHALLSIQLLSHPKEPLPRSCVLTEGECQFDVMILHIDMQAETVRVRNVGIEQTLTLAR